MLDAPWRQGLTHTHTHKQKTLRILFRRINFVGGVLLGRVWAVCGRPADPGPLKKESPNTMDKDVLVVLEDLWEVPRSIQKISTHTS